VVEVILKRIASDLANSEEPLKILINISFHLAELRHVLMGKVIAAISNLDNLAQQQFLLLRLFFLLTIDSESCEIFTKTNCFEAQLLRHTLSHGAAGDIVEALRVRYNQVQAGVLSHEL